MRKPKKTAVPDLKESFTGASGNYLPAKADFSELGNRATSNDSGKAQKEISGVWVLVFLLGLLVLLVVQHWLRQ